MTAWLKILLVLILGGILSTLGDRLGSKVGKARLSIFKLRPKSTAVLITVFTGSIISAISFAIMVAFNSQLRVGLFELEDIQAKITDREKELKKLEKNLQQKLFQPLLTMILLLVIGFIEGKMKR